MRGRWRQQQVSRAESSDSAGCNTSQDIGHAIVIPLYVLCRHGCPVTQQKVQALWAISSRLSSRALHRRQEERNGKIHLAKVTDAVEAEGRPPACCQATRKAFAISRLKQIRTPHQSAASYAVHPVLAHVMSPVQLFWIAYVCAESPPAKTAICWDDVGVWHANMPSRARNSGQQQHSCTHYTAA